MRTRLQRGGIEMTEQQIRRCEQFIMNRDDIKVELSWENTYMYALCADIYLTREKIIKGTSSLYDLK